MEDIKQLIKDLFHWNWGVSESARTKLLQLGGQAVPDLIDALWLYQERDGSDTIRNLIVLIGKPAVDHLIPHLTLCIFPWPSIRCGEVNFIRKKAAEILGEIGDVRALLPLIQNLDSPQELRYLVAKALEKILEKQKALEYIRANRDSIFELYGDSLMKCLMESDLNTASFVVTHILYEIGSLAVPKLMQMIEKEEPTKGGRFHINLEFNSPTLALMNFIGNCKSIEELDKIRIQVKAYVVDKDKDSQIRKTALSLLHSLNARKNQLLAGQFDIQLDPRIKPPKKPEGGSIYRAKRICA